MTPEEFASDLESEVNQAVDGFTGYAERHEKRVFAEIQGQLKELTTYPDGRIKPTSANIRKAKAISRRLTDTIITPEYEGKVNALLSDMLVIRATVDDYLYKAFGDAFNPSKPVFDAIYENAVFLTRNTLTEAGLKPNAIAGIEKIIMDNTLGNMQYRDMLEQLRGFVTGGDDSKGMLIGSGKGKLNLKTTLRDGINQFTANYQQTFATGIGNQFYLYCCGKVEDSRPWCLERVGKYWAEKEIESWANQDWKGKNPNTTKSNILVFRGGYNCMHSFIPVSTAIVPEEDVARARSLGYI